MILHSKIKLDCKIPSCNFMYHPKRSGRWVSLYLDPVVASFQKELFDKCKMDIIDKLPRKDRITAIVSYYIFLVNENFWERDVSNFNKAAEDAIFNNTKDLGYDDSMVIHTAQSKLPILGPESIHLFYGFLSGDDTHDILQLVKLISFARQYHYIEDINREIASNKLVTDMSFT